MVKEDIAESFREGDKVCMVHGGANKAGRFLEVSVYKEGSRKGALWLLEGRFGQAGFVSRVSYDLWQFPPKARLGRRCQGLDLCHAFFG